MQRKNLLRKSGYALVMLALLLTAPAYGQWQQIELPGGGVIEDLCKVEVGDVDVVDVVWAAGMGSGLFRTEWVDDAAPHYSSWTEYRPGIGFLGVDAIYSGSAEHVLGGGSSGIWYTTAITTPSVWSRPSYYYPEAWKTARIHDVAFWCGTGGSYPTIPLTEYVALLGEDISTSIKAGIYKWKNTSPYGFERVDAALPTSPSHGFAQIWRDMGNANALWTVGQDQTDPNKSHLYRLKDSYGGIAYTEVDFAAAATQGNSTQVVGGFNQWDDSGTIYTYVLAKYYDGNDNHIGVFVGRGVTDLDVEEISSDDVELVWTASSAEEDFFDIDNNNTDPVDPLPTILQKIGSVVGRKYTYNSTTYHHLWIACNGKDTPGMLYKDSQSTIDPIQIVGTGDIPGLTRWNAHCTIPDFQDHITGTGAMRLLQGTHHGGAFQLNFTSSNHTWTHLASGMNSTQMRGIQIVDDNGSPTLLAPTSWTGIFKKVYGNDWMPLAGSSTDPELNTTFNKGIFTAKKWDYSGNPDIYWFASCVEAFTLDGNPISSGGLYTMSSDGTSVSRIEFDPDNGGSDESYAVTRIKDGTASGSHFLYVATGSVGPEYDGVPDHTHVICQYKNTGGSSWAWDRIYQSDSNDSRTRDLGLGILAVEPDPNNAGSIIYVGRGNFFGASVGQIYYARVDLVEDIESTLWDSTTIWTAPNVDDWKNTSVFDIAAIADPSYTGKSIIFWGVGKMTAQDDATAYWNCGTIMMRRWDGDSYENEVIYDFDATGPVTLGNVEWTKSPCCTSLEAFTFNGNVFLVALLTGDVTTNYQGDIPIPWQKHVFTYDLGNDTWINHGLPLNYLGSEIYPQHFDVQIDPLHGYDIYTTTYGRVLWIDRDAQETSMSSNTWHWISFNKRESQDSLKYLFGDQSSITEIKDMYHQSYKPNNNPPIDNIHTWNWLQGYSVKTSSADTLRVLGVKIPADTTITLFPALPDSSWSFYGLAYLPEDTLNVNDAFLADSDYVIIVKNDQGQFWSPGDGPDFDMVPGEGYSIGVSDTFDYVYPTTGGSNRFNPGPGIKEQQKGTNSLTASHFQFTPYTGDYYAIYIDELLVNGNPPSEGDEVSCFTPENLCVGAGVYEGSFPIKLAAWKDDPTTEVIDGYTSGELLSFKYYDASANIEIPLEMQLTGLFSGQGVGAAYTHFEQGYFTRHLLSGSYALPQSYNLAQNFPNPFNPATTIRYDLPYDSRVTLEIFDISGRKVVTLVDGMQSAGFRALHWMGKNPNGGDLASGVYFCRIKADATQEHFGKIDRFEKTLKMVMVK